MFTYQKKTYQAFSKKATEKVLRYLMEILFHCRQALSYWLSSFSTNRQIKKKTTRKSLKLSKMWPLISLFCTIYGLWHHLSWLTLFYSNLDKFTVILKNLNFRSAFQNLAPLCHKQFHLNLCKDKRDIKLHPVK
jgi:hypothetical protein